MQPTLKGFRRGAITSKIGDLLVFSSFPENYYLHFGEKLVDIDKLFVFDYNPFVLRHSDYSEIFELRQFQIHIPDFPYPVEICNKFGIKARINHPRLYIHENERKIYKSLCINTTGETRGAMTFKTINEIKKRYPDYFIVQVGLKTDRDAGVLDRRGLSLWDSVKYIAQSEVFIGVDSAMMWCALSYPEVKTKIVYINPNNPKELEESTQLGWIPKYVETYNETDFDIGITKSVKKI